MSLSDCLPLGCDWRLPGDANLKRQGDPLALDIWKSSVEAQRLRLIREFRNEAIDNIAREHPMGWRVGR